MSESNWFDEEPVMVPRSEWQSRVEQMHRGNSTFLGGPVSNQSQPQWNLAWVGWLIVGFLIAWILFNTNRDKGTDGEDSSVRVDGTHLMILEQNSDRDRLTPDQVGVFTSKAIRQEVDTLKAQYRLVDVDDVPQLSSPWKELVPYASKTLPSAVIAKGNKVYPFDVKDAPSIIEKLRAVDRGGR